MNLIITCQRNLEELTISEIQNILERLGDTDAIIEKTIFSGIIQIKTKLDNMKIIEGFKEIIEDEPWLIKYCSRIIPIQEECESKLDEIRNKVIGLSNIIKKNDTYRITIEKRQSSLHNKEIISKIADSLSNKVSLENSDWEIIIQILRNKTGISIIPPNSILSVHKEKRIDLD
ncbi:THUMP domain-containing protein [Candidatus Nitrosopelagicus sp.]|nr:THUMP domain-containing protein [Candidatus Nitrosopelagicus sp.]|tara:strand:- start:427 stop:948 length:522 start_codon:yes stop_codon:yes gene_type:complete